MQAEQFAAHASVEQHHWWFTGRRAILSRVIGAVLPVGGAIADVGCGTGGNAAALAAAGYEVLGLDPAPAAIAHARARFPEVAFRQSDDPGEAARHLAGAPAALILMADVLEHVADDRGLLAAAIAALPAGGHLLLTVPADPSLWSGHDLAFGHHRRYRRDDLAALWADHPVTVRLLAPFNARLRPLVALHRRLFGHRAASGGDLDVPTGPLNHLLHRVFAGEASLLVDAIDRDSAPWRRGVSLMALLRRT